MRVCALLSSHPNPTRSDRGASSESDSERRLKQSKKKLKEAKVAMASLASAAAAAQLSVDAPLVLTVEQKRDAVANYVHPPRRVSSSN